MSSSFLDANCVVGRVIRPTPGMLGTPSEIVNELKRLGIHEAVVTDVHALEYSVHDGNQKTIDVVRDFPGTLHPAWVLPQHSTLDVEEPESYVEEMLAQGVRAIRVTAAAYHGHLVEEWALGPVWRLLEQAHVPVLVAGSDLGRYPDGPTRGFSANNIHSLCQTYPQLPIVVLRLNFSALRVIVPLLEECPNLFVENSFFTSHRGLELLAGRVGAGRIVFGSGLPWGSPGPALAAIAYAKLSNEEKELISAENLRRLLHRVGT